MTSIEYRTKYYKTLLKSNETSTRHKYFLLDYETFVTTKQNTIRFSRGNCSWLHSMVELQQSIARLRDHEDKSCRTLFEKYMNQDMCQDTKVNKFLHIHPFIPQNGDITNWRSGWYLYATRCLFPETWRMLISTLRKILVQKNIFQISYIFFRDNKLPYILLIKYRKNFVILS